MAREIAIGRDQAIWVAAETTMDTGVWPTSAGTVLVTSDTDFKQSRIFLDDPQKRNSKGQFPHITGVFPGGEFTFTFLVKPSGSLGVVPSGAPILKALYGVETITGSTSVVYTQDGIDDLPTISILVKDNFETTFYTGCAVSKGEFPVMADETDAALFQCTASGVFLSKYIAGTDELASEVDGTSTPVTAIPVLAAHRYNVGAKITVGTDDNSGTGFEITAVDTGTNTLTVTPGVATLQVAASTVEGWTPTISEVGTPVHGRYGAYTEDRAAAGAADVLITGATVTYDNAYTVPNKEKTQTAYPGRIIPGIRVVEVAVTEYFRKTSTGIHYDADNDTDFDCTLAAGDVAGTRARFTFNNVRKTTPEYSGDEERESAFMLKPFETAGVGNDATTLVFD